MIRSAGSWHVSPVRARCPSDARPDRRRLALGLAVVAVICVIVLGEWARARAAPSRPATADSSSAPAAVPPRSGTAAQRSPAQSTTSPTVQAAIERYRRAVESRSLALLLAAYPAMEPDQVATYREFFRTADRVRFEVIIQDLEQKDGEARMKLQGFLRYRERRTGVERITTYGTRARLVDGPTGWRILDIH